MSAWKKIDDYYAIPEHTHVLLSDGVVVSVGNRNARGFTIFGEYPYCYYQTAKGASFTHWMPLPAPPTVQPVDGVGER